MKKVLVTGAGGMIGRQTVNYLLKEGNFEITALDLKSKKSVKKLKPFQNKINVIYGDINDKVLIAALVKDHDYIIHLAAVLPPLADIKPELTKIVNYEGTKIIVDAINKYNPDCFLLFSSSISVYGDRIDTSDIKVTDSVGASDYDFYANTKILTEDYIRKNLNNYCIFRLTAIMGRPDIDPLMFHMPLKTKLEILSDLDCAYAFAKAIEHKKELNKKTYNVSGGNRCRTTYNDFLINMFKIYGLNFKFLLSSAFAEKNFHCGYLADNKELENILHYQRDTLKTYYNRVERTTNKFTRFFAKMFSKPIIKALVKKSEPYKARKEKNEKLIKRFFKR